MPDFFLPAYFFSTIALFVCKQDYAETTALIFMEQCREKPGKNPKILD